MPKILLILLLLAPGAALAQEALTGPMDFKDADLELVIETVAKLTGKSFIYDDRIRGQVTVIAGEGVTVDEAYKIFESILAVKGFTTVPAPGGVLKIVPIREAKESPIATIEGERYTPNRDLFITRLIPLKFVKAETINNTIKPLVSKDASVIAYAPTNTLIITDTATNIRRLLTIIAEIDIATYSETIKVFPLEHADANQLSGQLREIFGADEGPVQAAARARRTRRTATEAAASSSDAVGSVGEPRFIVDERTNAIIVIATRAAIAQIANLIELLDYQRKGTGRIHVYRLQNADAEEMAETLSSLTSGSGGRTAPTTPGAGRVTPGGAGVTASLDDGVRVTADPPTNSLIIQATPESFSTISEVIEALDIRRPQVLVEALLMEVKVDDSSDLGIGWLYQSTIGDDEESRIGIGTGGVFSGGELGTGESFLGGAIGDAAGLTSAVLGRTITIVNEDTGESTTLPVIQAVIQATDTNSDTNIIAAPTLLTADNEEAEIIVGENIPIPTSRLQAASGADNDFQTSQNISRQDVGVTLRVTPQISEGDTVRLQIFQELSDVSEQAATGTEDFGPTTLNRQVENTVYVRDGEAVMIGGILTENQNETVSKVPWLGDIPILGWFFKTRGESVRKTNLLVILTPHIVRDPQDLNRLTTEHRERFRDSAGKGIHYSDEEIEARRKAIEAGLDLPDDSNPVRRELSRHTSVYPTEELPYLRSEHLERERARLDEIEALKAAERSGNYVVQVSFFGDADEAVRELERMISEGYDGSLLSQSERGRVVHYVQVGPYQRELEAQQAARELRANLDLDAIVVVTP
jgi:general secretion pathway protein D